MAVFLTPDSVSTLGGVQVKEYLLTKHNPNGIDMPQTSMEGKVLGVTIHNTDWIIVSSQTTPAEQYTRATVNGNMNDVRVHYYVDDVCAWQNLPLTLAGWHAADGSGNGNRRTVAIECIMSKEYNDRDKKSEDNCAKMAAALLKQFGLGIDSLFTHTYWMNVRDGKTGTVDELNVMQNRTKMCPAYILPHWLAFKEKVRQYLEGTPLFYRVRKTWEDASSQTGAYTVLKNAVNSCAVDYHVYDSNGTLIYTNTGKEPSTDCPYNAPVVVVKRGMYGNDVRWVQWQLTERGYSVGASGIDGDFGANTERGLKAFQEVEGLEVDGICGPITRKALGGDTPQPTPTGFKPRLTRPEKGNKFYIRRESGGYATAIKGNPTDPWCDVLANCFIGSTKIITRNGARELSSLVGEKVDVLTVDGEYHEAVGGYYGEQETFIVTCSNGQSFECSGNHRWLVKDWRNGNNLIIKHTTDLSLGDCLPYFKSTDLEPDEDAIRHGFIYGDGSGYNEGRQSQANLCGDKRVFMARYFEDSTHRSTEANGTIECYPYPAYYKQSIPDITQPLEYLKGFIIGLIASDGCVDKYGCPSISTVKLECAQKVQEILTVLGVRSHITTETRDTNYKNNSTLYRVIIKKPSIDESYFINPKHRSRFCEKDRSISFTKIKSIVSTGEKRAMYCVSEPVTTTMVLEGGIITGQCVGYAHSRFHEIANNTAMNLFDPVNAENIYQNAINHGLEVGQEPRLGALIVWQKGPTLSGSDGAGHVAVVEQINADGSVITSESGYGCANPFWTSTRRYPWPDGDGYKFLGFVYNPAVK